MKVVLPGHILHLAKEFQARGYEFYVVGGALRDQLMHKKPLEWDVATNALPDQTLEIFNELKLSKIYQAGKRFGTIAGHFHGEPIEVTTYRSEDYQIDSRKPEVRFGDSIDEDLSRRDFTINAIAYDPVSERLIDNHQGIEDITARQIRSVGKAVERFSEDPLRMLRAIRFATVFDFQIERKTFQGILDNKERLAVLSSERVQQEMNKILLADKPSRGIELLRETGLIAYTLPELIPSIDLEFDAKEHKDIYHHILQVLDSTPAKLELRWCALLHDIAKPLTRKKIGGEYHFIGHETVGAKMSKQILERLKYPSDFVKYVSKLVRLHQRLPNDDGTWTDGAVRRFVRDAGECLEDLFIFAAADSTGKNERKLESYRKKREDLKERISELNKQAEIDKLRSPLSGEELMDIFHRPAGPWIKPIKDELLRMVIDGELYEQDKQKATEIAKKMISANNKG